MDKLIIKHLIMKSNINFSKIKKTDLSLLLLYGGDDQNRTGDRDFADLGLTAWRRRHIFLWCPEAESNHRHEDFQSSALPTELSGPRDLNGGSDETRTRGLLRDRQAL